MINIRLPNITAATEKEQIMQIKSYLHQLVGDLNWALSTLESENLSKNKQAVENTPHVKQEGR